MAKKRIITNKLLWYKLTEGCYKEIIEFAADKQNELDVQIRDNYLNIYYRGGNFLRIKPKCYEFDEFYFHIDVKEIRKTHLKNNIKNGDKKAIIKWQTYKNKRKELLSILDEPNGIHQYSTETKEIMNKWLDAQKSIGVSHDEKNEQQNISMNNWGNTDYTVIDVEYQVSETSSFYYNEEESTKRPRFDIIAVDDEGQLYVIELKKGLGAIEGKSGIKSHIDSFKHTIGRDYEGDFINEMSEMINQKKQLGLIDNNTFININLKPKFIFAFSDKCGKDEFGLFMKACKKFGFNGKIIYLDNNHKLSNK